MHWIHRRPPLGKSLPPGVFYRHFRGISTGWKDARADASGIDPATLVRDEAWARLAASLRA